MKERDEVGLQRAYYAQTAGIYDTQHVSDDDAHAIALRFMIAMVPQLNIKSVLDLGSGTGRTLLTLKRELPHIRVIGVEPSIDLREIGYAKGLSRTELIDGDGTKLTFADGSFDMVCEFAALHHIRNPSQAVSEMLRVAKTAIFISDSNNFAQGSSPSRFIKQLFNSLSLWPVANFVKTRGKGYIVTEGDGVSYSYSVFNDFRRIQSACSKTFLLNTANTGSPNLYRSAENVALLAIKNDAEPSRSRSA